MIGRIADRPRPVAGPRPRRRGATTVAMHYTCSTMTDRIRFDPELLDEHDPFEIDDDNGPHLAKHASYTSDDVIDAWRDPHRLLVAATADGPADWLLVARLGGGDLVRVPLAASRSGLWNTCRPIGIYQASPALADLYNQENP